MEVLLDIRLRSYSQKQLTQKKIRKTEGHNLTLCENLLVTRFTVDSLTLYWFLKY